MPGLDKCDDDDDDVDVKRESEAGARPHKKTLSTTTTARGANPWATQPAETTLGWLPCPDRQKSKCEREETRILYVLLL